MTFKFIFESDDEVSMQYRPMNTALEEMLGRVQDGDWYNTDNIINDDNVMITVDEVKS